MTRRSALILTIAAALMAGCTARDPELMTFRGGGTGPDEFLVAPAKPLEMPPPGAGLPPPARGAANRADATPKADAVAALGGRPSALQGGAVPASDGGLIAHASRFGRDPAIRSELAEADLDFRQRNPGRLLERAFNVNTYYRAYENQSLNQSAETQRLRRAGVPTSAGPVAPQP